MEMVHAVMDLLIGAPETLLLCWLSSPSPGDALLGAALARAGKQAVRSAVLCAGVEFAMAVAST